MSYADFEELKGKTLSSIENIDDTELVFTTSTGDVYKLYHEQECCEYVSIADICGDLCDLLGEPLLVAEEVRHDNCVAPEGLEDCGLADDSFTWTFYKLDTKKGGVTIKWVGSSNGYYSESVDFCKLD